MLMTVFAFFGLAIVLIAAGPDAVTRAFAYGLWGLCTTLLFAPMGGLLALAISDHARVAAAGAALVSLLGVGVGIGLLVHAARVAKGTNRHDTEIGWLTVVHHALVFGAIGAAMFEPTPWHVVMLGELAIPCAIGGFLGYRMLTAERVTG